MTQTGGHRIIGRGTVAKVDVGTTVVVVHKNRIVEEFPEFILLDLQQRLARGEEIPFQWNHDERRNIGKVKEAYIVMRQPNKISERGNKPKEPLKMMMIEFVIDNPDLHKSKKATYKILIL